MSGRQGCGLIRRRARFESADFLAFDSPLLRRQGFRSPQEIWCRIAGTIGRAANVRIDGRCGTGQKDGSPGWSGRVGYGPGEINGEIHP